MGIWDDIGEQTGVWTGYAGLSPEEALNKWYRTQQQMKAAGFQPGQQGPGGEILGSMEGLNQQNPAAFRLLQSGKDRVKREGTDTRQIFNPQTGQWQTQEVKGWWSHPESWGQLIAGGLMGGVVAPAAISSGAGAAPAGGLSSMGADVAGATSADVAASGGTVGALGGGAAAAGPTAVAGPSTAGGLNWGQLAPYLIGGGVDLLGGYMGSKAAKDAAKQQMAYGEKAMNSLRDAYGQQLGFYGQQRDVYTPYNQIGAGALRNLAGLTGMPAPQAAPQAAPAGPTMVRMVAPDGSTQAVPSGDVQHYIQRGARLA